MAVEPSIPWVLHMTRERDALPEHSLHKERKTYNRVQEARGMYSSDLLKGFFEISLT